MSAAARARQQREDFLKQQQQEIDDFRRDAEEAQARRNVEILQMLKDTRRPDEAINRQNAIKHRVFRIVSAKEEQYPVRDKYLRKRLLAELPHFEPSDEEVDRALQWLVRSGQLERNDMAEALHAMPCPPCNDMAEAASLPPMYNPPLCK